MNVSGWPKQHESCSAACPTSHQKDILTSKNEQSMQTSIVYLQANGCAALLDCFHGIFYLVNAPLWTPSDHILVILRQTRACQSQRVPPMQSPLAVDALGCETSRFGCPKSLRAKVQITRCCTSDEIQPPLCLILCLIRCCQGLLSDYAVSL